MFIAIKQVGEVDPNWDKVSKRLDTVGGNYNAIKWAHLKPVKVKKDTKNNYIAKYRDDHGSYWFEIRKNANNTYHSRLGFQHIFLVFMVGIYQELDIFSES